MLGRRKNVRVRPTADYQIVIDYGDGLIKTRLTVLDAAVGGVGLEVDENLLAIEVGADIKLGVVLPGFPRFETVGSLRYTQGKVGARCGIHLNRLTQPQQVALTRTVSELLERGASV
jgi:hypothetical protein